MSQGNKFTVGNEKLKQVCYLNFRRIKLLCYWHGHALDLSSCGRISVLPEPGKELDSLVAEVICKLGRIDLPTIPVEKLLSCDSEIQGKYASFDMEFSLVDTTSPESENNRTMTNDDGSKGQYLFSEVDDYRLIVSIDKKWVHPCNASIHFNTGSGQIDLEGIGFIDGMDGKSKVIRMTPYMITAACK